MLDKAGSPLELQKEIYIRLDIAEAGDLWMSLVFLYHDVHCVAPACQNVASRISLRNVVRQERRMTFWMIAL